jgi:hypothetical protein
MGGGEFFIVFSFICFAGNKIKMKLFFLCTSYSLYWNTSQMFSFIY